MPLRPSDFLIWFWRIMRAMLARPPTAVQEGENDLRSRNRMLSWWCMGASVVVAFLLHQGVIRIATERHITNKEAKKQILTGEASEKK
jgi:hypothetical protein